MLHRTTVDESLRALFTKLGHELEEIRTRALLNIVSKLEHNLLCDADLVQEKQLHIRLLEWFNFPSCNNQETVLQLILRLTKHPSCAALYVEIGAIEFCTQLRADLHPSLRKLIDNILDDLFHLPSQPTLSHNQECFYKQTPGEHAHTTHAAAPSNGSGDGWPIGLSSLSRQGVAEERGNSSHQHESFLISTQKQPTKVAKDQKKHRHTGEEQIGYFNADSAKKAVKHKSALGATTGTAAFKLQTLPWTSLVMTDRHVLTATESQLHSTDALTVIKTCEFFSDVVFQDFPAEVFLQRPTIVKTMLSLMSVVGMDTSGVAVTAAMTLHQLVKSMRARIQCQRDPSVFLPNSDPLSVLSSTSSSSNSFLSQSAASSGSRPSLIGGRSDVRHLGDGLDIDNYSQKPGGGPGVADNSVAEEPEEVQMLQHLQWTLAQFCMAILERAVPCLKVKDEQFATHAIQLLHSVLSLLCDVVSFSQIWHDQHTASLELREQLRGLLDMLADVLAIHHNINLADVSPHADVHHVMYIAIAELTARLISVIAPAGMRSTVLSPAVPLLLTLCHDEMLAVSSPHIRALAIMCLKEISEEHLLNFYHAQDVCVFLEQTCRFLLDFKYMNDDKAMELLAAAEDAVQSLPYHLSMPLVQGCLQLASFICKKASPSPTALSGCRKVTLTLLSHPLNQVRLEAYTTTLGIVKAALGVDSVANPTSASCHTAAFLLDADILHELVAFGLTDTMKEVRTAGEQVMLYLLQSQLLWPSHRWQQLVDSLTAVCPLLQCFASTEVSLGRVAMAMLTIEAIDGGGSLPMLEKFRGTLRLLFHSDVRVRSEALNKLARFLAKEADTAHKLPVFSELNVSNLANVLIVDSPRSLLDQDSCRSVFQVESMLKVYDIFTSASHDGNVQKSAVEQLAIMLQDPYLQQPFIDKGGLQLMLQLLRQGTRVSESGLPSVASMAFLPSALRVVRSLVQNLTSVRRDMAQSMELHYLAIRCALLLRQDANACRDAAELLMLLVFDECFRLQSHTSSDGESHSVLALPAVVTQSFQLPMKTAVYATTSNNRCLLPPDPDPLLQADLCQMLRVAWNRAWHGDLDSIVTSDARATDKAGFHPRLVLSAKERTVLAASLVPHAVQSCVHLIDNATSHHPVAKAVHRLALYVVACRHTDVAQLMHSLGFKLTSEKFLTVMPSSSADEHLCVELLQLCALLISERGVHPSSPHPGSSGAASGQPGPLFSWLSGLLLSPKATIMGLLQLVDNTSDSATDHYTIMRRRLLRQMLKFVCELVSEYPYILMEGNVNRAIVSGELTKRVLLKINRTEAVHFYNLPTLETVLECLLHVTARPGWSCECADMNSVTLCQQLLQSMVEVLFAFHNGRGGLMTYMGGGVIRCATLCLAHLTHEMATQISSKDWPRSWLISRQATADFAGESGFQWLLLLGSYRDAEVRAASLAIITALASTEPGRITMETHCQHVPGGIWGHAFRILLDPGECCLVRQQAALLLVNLTSQPMPSSDSPPGAGDMWQGPVVRDNQVAVVGLSALLTLLHHSDFYPKMAAMLASFYPYPQLALSPSGSALPLLNITGSSSASQGLDPSAIEPSTESEQSTDMTGSLVTPPPTAATRSVPPVAMVTPGLMGSFSATAMQSSMNGGRVESTVSSSLEGATVVTPPLVSSLCRLLGNLFVLAQQDTVISLQHDNIINALLSLLRPNLLEGMTQRLRLGSSNAGSSVASSSSSSSATLISVSTIPSILSDSSSSRDFHLHHQQQVTADRRQQQRDEDGALLLGFQHQLHMHADIVRLLTLCVRTEASVGTLLCSDVNMLVNIVQLLAIVHTKEADCRSLCGDVWHGVWALSTALLKSTDPAVVTAIKTALLRTWRTVTGRLLTVLQDRDYAGSDVWLTGLQFLARLLVMDVKGSDNMEEAQDSTDSDAHSQTTIGSLLDSTLTSSSSDRTLVEASSGSQLCYALVKAYESVGSRPIDQYHVVKTTVMYALKALLAASTSAKARALEASLVELIFANINQLHKKLGLDALDSKVNKRRSFFISDIILHCDLLMNFMHGQSDVKMAVWASDLGGLVMRLWAWCQVEPLLMSSVLSLLCTYSARCSQAASSLALTSVPDGGGSRSQQHGTNSVLHCVLRELQRESSPTGNASLLRLGFRLVSTLSLSNECRGLLWKSNYLNDFAKLSPAKGRKSASVRMLESLWLALLTNLSFSTDGQAMILKIDDSLSILLECGSMDYHRQSVSLIVRNLCCHAANKQKLLTNDKLLPFLILCLELGPEQVSVYASSALWCLAFNSQKAKAGMKSSQIVNRLNDIYNHYLELQLHAEWVTKCRQYLHNVLTILNS